MWCRGYTDHTGKIVRQLAPVDLILTRQQRKRGCSFESDKCRSEGPLIRVAAKYFKTVSRFSVNICACTIEPV